MADYYVDPNSTGGDGTTTALTGANAAYASRSAGEAARQGVLANPVIFYTRRNGSAKDTTALTVNGSTTSAANYMAFIGHDDYWCGGKYDDTKDIFEVTDGVAITISDEYVRIVMQQIELLSPTANGKNALYVGSIASGGSDIRIERCVIKSHANGTYYNWVIDIQDADATMKISNTSIFNMSNLSSQVGIRLSSAGSSYIYNNTIYGANNGYGIRNVSGTTYTKNNICTNFSSNAIVESGGTLYCNYNASSDATADDQDGDGTSGNNRVNQTFSFVNAGAGDFHLQSDDTGALNCGTDLSGDGSYPISVDIDGVTRSGTWDIGADEYITSAVELTAQNIDLSAITIGESIIGQIHALTGQNILLESILIDNSIIGQLHNLLSQDILLNQIIIDEASLSKIVNLISQDIILQSYIIDQTNIGQLHNLFSTDINLSAITIDETLISQLHNLISQNILLSGIEIDEASLTRMIKVILNFAGTTSQNLGFSGNTITGINFTGEINK